ncbi:YeiH family protein [Roseateles sp. SL47]|uniref:YeiH family protein n=1 Tax=Roseateles sp. SL47 TaxID=2995138 RepID=UPI00226DC716|nr:YeiH family protein [Roseateles sp. SL47]WAC71505.1 YeiH family protein [Roseateles sp. SL47]
MSSSVSAPAWPRFLQFREALRRLGPGLVVCLVLASLALSLARLPWLQAHGLSALTLSIVLGMLAGHSVYPSLAAAAEPGVQFTRQTLLRLGIVLYGLKLTVQDIGQMGLAGVTTDALVVASTLMLGAWAGRRWLKLDREQALLISAGSAICGAAAVMATAPAVQARDHQVAPAIATVVVFGTLAMFLYPWMFALNQSLQWIPGGAHGFGLYTGATIHEVAQVVVAGRGMSPEATDAAVMAKMVRVMMLAPVLLALGVVLSRRDRKAASLGASVGAVQGASPKSFGINVPWFAFAFMGVVLLHSWLPVPAAAAGDLSRLDDLLLAMAMAGLGLGTQLSAVRRSGPRPLWLALLLFVWLVVGGAAISRMTSWLFM